MSIFSIDWEQCIERVGGKELAKTLLELFIQHLPESRNNITKAYQEKDIDYLAEQVHRLYGACCYCVLPKLISILTQLLEVIKLEPLNNQALSELYYAFEKEVDVIYQEYEMLKQSGVLV